MNWVEEYLDQGYIHHQAILQSEVDRLRQDIAIILKCEVQNLDEPELAVDLNRQMRKNPQIRNAIYQNLQTIDSLSQLKQSEKISQILSELKFDNPTLCEIKAQIYFPWETCFFQGWHQDINTYSDRESVTMWVPITQSNMDSSVRFLPKSHQGGPIVHQAYEDPQRGIWHAQLPKQESYQDEITSAVISSPGDLVCLNRLVHHTSPKQQLQQSLRIVIVLRYDSNNDEHKILNPLRKEDYTPYSPQYYSENIIPQVRDYLLKKPQLFNLDSRK